MLPKVRSVQVGGVEFGGGSPLALIAGPCVIESADHTLMMAEKLQQAADAAGLALVFKASYDKANRSSLDSYRGPGLEAGLRILERVKAECGVPVLSDVHLPQDMAPAAEVLDCIQIPAFLSRQTDMLLAAGKTGKPVAVKKGQFLAPWDTAPLLRKVESTGNQQVMITERGFSFGYNNLVSDMRSLPTLRELGVPVIFDATHSVQLPGGLGTSSGGERKFVSTLARAATAAGIDGLFLEVHDAPGKALCDGANMLSLAELPELLESVLAIDSVVRQ
ncbi:MAG: 3-deoxy-8-phosphooctulonate synthase [Planctomycetes bacterium]|nr:3-deoxy-8-phosphooctulonate synthase [Planctomycetota bacterium]